MGRFCKFQVANKNHYLNSNFEAAVDDSESERQDIRFAMNKINGKSVFSTPQPRDIISGEYDNYITSETNRRRISTIRFNVDSAGNLDTDTDIKLRLGWTLGFRAAEYVMGRETPGYYQHADFGRFGGNRLHNRTAIRLLVYRRLPE